MGAVTQWFVRCSFAGTKINCLITLGEILHRREAGIFVRPVAERLRIAFTAGAPPIFLPLLDIHGTGFLLRDYRIVHNHPL